MNHLRAISDALNNLISASENADARPTTNPGSSQNRKTRFKTPSSTETLRGIDQPSNTSPSDQLLSPFRAKPKPKPWGEVKGSHTDNFLAFSPVDELIARHLLNDLQNIEDDVAQAVQSIEDQYNNHDNNLQMDPMDELQRHQQTLDTREMYTNQLQEATKLSDKGWSYDTILAYLKLARRSYEPIFPLNFKQDFPRFPPALFEKLNTKANPIIRGIHKPDYQACMAFEQFLLVGRDVRERLDRPIAHKPLEQVIYKRIKSYLKFGWKDANMLHEVESGWLPKLYVIVRNKKSPEMEIDHEGIQNSLLKQLRQASKTLLGFIRTTEENEEQTYILEPPTIWGFAITRSVVAIAAYEPLNPSRNMRSIAFYKFGLLEEEAWNVMSLAILFNWIRYAMLRIKLAMDEREIFPPPQTPLEDSDD